MEEKKDTEIIEAKEANRQLSLELEKKDKIIDEMAKFIANLDIDEDICKNIQCKNELNKLQKNCSECIKQYFTEKVEGKYGN